MKLLLSQVKALPFDLATEVDGYIAALKRHQHTTGEAPPAAKHPLIERCVVRTRYSIQEGRADDLAPSIEIEDDTPAVEAASALALEVRKAQLANAAAQEAQRLAAAVSPVLKRRLTAIQYSDAQREKAQLSDIPVAKRFPDHAQRISRLNVIIASHDQRLGQLLALERHLAKLEAEIHDLNEVTIEAWKPAPFPNGVTA